MASAPPPPPPYSASITAEIPSKTANMYNEVPANNVSNNPYVTGSYLPASNVSGGFVASNTAPSAPIFQEVPVMATASVISSSSDLEQATGYRNEGKYYYGNYGPPPGSTVRELALNGTYVTIVIPADAVRGSYISYYY
jgi:hypothetical protein